MRQSATLGVGLLAGNFVFGVAAYGAVAAAFNPEQRRVDCGARASRHTAADEPGTTHSWAVCR